MSSELFFQSIAQLAGALDAKTLSSVELTRAVIARTQAVESRVHAFNSLDEADALAQAAASDARRAAGQARGPLDGIPIGLKDVIAVEGQPLTLWGDGHARKDFLYYTDFLSAVEQIAAQRLTGTFNLSAGESHTVHEVIALVEKHTGRQVALAFQPAATWDVEDSRLSNQRLMAAADWRPLVSLDEGVRRAAAGYSGH
jgi:hypothetical protein